MAGASAAKPITYNDLSESQKAVHDGIKRQLEEEIFKAYEWTRQGKIKFKGFEPEGALDNVDLSTPGEERTRA